MNNQTKTKQLEQLIEQTLSGTPFEMVLVEFKRSGGDWILRVFFDHPDGVTLDHCSTVSRTLSDVLDTSDVIKHAYQLEVSSPGVDRPLVKPGDFQRFLENRIYVKIHEAVEGRKVLTGQLIAAGDQEISIQDETDQKIYRISLTNISKATLKPILDFH